MKFTIYRIFLLLLFTSCASNKNNTLRIQNRIAAEEVRTLKEIQLHSEMILEGHPELSNSSKLKVKKYMNEALGKQQLLKDEESKIVQLLLSKSLRVNQLTDAEQQDKKSLKKRLQSVYESKAENIFSLVSQITEMSENNEINESFENDMQLFMREIR
jgi:hypothetical protein